MQYPDHYVKTASEWATYFTELANENRGVGETNDQLIYLPIEYRQEELIASIRDQNELDEADPFTISNDEFRTFVENMQRLDNLWEHVYYCENDVIMEMWPMPEEQD